MVAVMVAIMVAINGRSNLNGFVERKFLMIS